VAPHASERVTDLLTPVVAESGLVLEGVTVTPAGKRRVVRVVVDLPPESTGALDLDSVALVSRAVGDALDGADVLGGAPYVLEVSSPGVDRPLTERRHWSRARGRLVTVPVAGDDGAGAHPVTGRVLSVDDDGVLLDEAATPRLVPWAALGVGAVQVEFSRDDADATDDTDDADADTDDPNADDDTDAESGDTDGLEA
jgi:ribosome maturation factor RimP